jgi:hypothetical protein
MNNEKTLPAIDKLLDTVNELKNERDEARKQAEDWRNVALVDPCLTAEQFKREVRGNPLPWEVLK